MSQQGDTYGGISYTWLKNPLMDPLGIRGFIVQFKEEPPELCYCIQELKHLLTEVFPRMGYDGLEAKELCKEAVDGRLPNDWSQVFEKIKRAHGEPKAEIYEDTKIPGAGQTKVYWWETEGANKVRLHSHRSQSRAVNRDLRSMLDLMTEWTCSPASIPTRHAVSLMKYAVNNVIQHEV